MEVTDVDSLIEQLADAVVKRIDEREKINIIAEAVMQRLREQESEKEADS